MRSLTRSSSSSGGAGRDAERASKEPLKFAGWRNLHDLCGEHVRLKCRYVSGSCQDRPADEKWELKTKTWTTDESMAKENEDVYAQKGNFDEREMEGRVDSMHCRYYVHFPVDKSQCIDTDEEDGQEVEFENLTKPERLPHRLLQMRRMMLSRQDELFNEVLRRINGERLGGFRSRFHRLHSGRGTALPMQPLKFCPKLMRLARDFWHYSMCYPDGFVAMPHNVVFLHKGGDESKSFGCLTYFTPRLEIGWLPMAMVEFWLNHGTPMPEVQNDPELDSHYEDFPSVGESYVHCYSPNAFTFYRMSGLFARQLLSRKCRRVGVYIDLAYEYWPKKQSLVCALVLFDVPTHPAAKELLKASAKDQAPETYRSSHIFMNCCLP